MTTETRPLDVHALRQSFYAAAAVYEERDQDFVTVFYDRLHDRRSDLWNPDKTPHFPPMGSPRMRRLIVKTGHTLVDTVEDLEDEAELAASYGLLGEVHAEIGALQDEYVIVVGSALIWTFQNALGDGWTEYLENQWGRAYETLIHLMRAGAGQ